MSTPAASTQPVFIALQANHDTQPVIEAIRADNKNEARVTLTGLPDNPLATVHEYPAMVRITAPGHLVIRRESVEELIGRDYDLRELQVNMISLAGEVDETETEFTLQWRS